MSQAPDEDPDPTLRDLPELRRAERRQRVQAAREHLEAGGRSTDFHVYASCERCGADVHGWRRHLGERIADGEEGVPRIQYDHACGVCDGSIVELRAEPPPRG